MMNDPDFMRTRPVLPLLLSMSIPMVLSMLVNSLYNIVDSYFVARISEDAMTALSLVYPVQNFISSVGVGFGVGINAAIAYHSGAGNGRRADAAATMGVLFGILHGIILTIASIAMMPSFLSMFTSSGAIISYGLRYSIVAFAFTLVNVSQITFEKIFQAVGRMKVSMAAMMAGCLTNIILDPLFIFGIGPVPEMGIEGAALATGLGQLVSLLIYLAVALCRPLSVHIGRRAVSWDGRMIARLYSVGIPATLNMALPSVLVSALNAILSIYSGTYILVLGIYYKLQTFLYLPASGFVQGMRPIIGYNYGAGDKERVRRIFLSATLLSAVIMLVGTILCMAVPSSLIALFTDNPGTIASGVSALRIISLGFIISSISVVASGALEGLGKGMPSLVISLLRYIILIIPLAYLLSRVLGIGPDGVWHSFWVSEAVTALLSLLIYSRSVRAL